MNRSAATISSSWIDFKTTEDQEGAETLQVVFKEGMILKQSRNRKRKGPVECDRVG